jgi:predicted ArsR family transcriptional regulator
VVPGDEELESQIEGIASLREPLRRALYLFVARAGRDVSREEAAEGVGVGRSLAAFHLDKLADEGLLDTAFRRLSGRTGPGAGRPSKLYRRSRRQLQVSLPSRNYELAASLLAEAVATAGEALSPLEALHDAAATLGVRIGERAQVKPLGRSRDARLAKVLEVLEEYGFEPYREGRTLYLRNCPFHALVEQHPDLVCSMNHALVQGVLSGLRATGLEALLAPAPGRCCVAIAADAGSRRR